MKAKRYIFQGSAIALLIAVAWFLDNKAIEHRAPAPENDPLRPELAMKTLPQVDQLQVNKTLAIAEALIEERATPKAEQLEIIERDDEAEEALSGERYAAWANAAEAGVSEEPSFPLNGQVREYEVVKTEKPKVLPAVGEKVEVPLLNGEKAKVQVKSTTVTRNGDYSWSGHVEGHDEDYPVVVTYGDHSAFAMITTPNGSYSMESVNGVGWLYKNPSEQELSLPGHEDFVEIPGETHIH